MQPISTPRLGLFHSRQNTARASANRHRFNDKRIANWAFVSLALSLSAEHLPMAASYPWNVPQIWISLLSCVFRDCGFLFGIMAFRWNRSESRLDALGKVLQPLFRAAQHMHKANKTRRTLQLLRTSFA